MLDEETVPIGVLNLGNKPAGVKKQLAFVAAAAGERGGTLVYCNGAAEAEEIALLISQLVGIEGEEVTCPNKVVQPL